MGTASNNVHPFHNNSHPALWLISNILSVLLSTASAPTSLTHPLEIDDISQGLYTIRTRAHEINVYFLAPSYNPFLFPGKKCKDGERGVGKEGGKETGKGT